MDTYVPEYLKIKNRRQIFDLFRNNNSLARSQLVSMTNMSFPTVCKSVDFLISKNMIIETDEPDHEMKGPGRKRHKIVFNSSAYYSIALNFEGLMVELGLVDLSGNVTMYRRHEFSDFQNYDEQVKLGREIKELIVNAGVPVLGIGVAFPSNINPKTNEIVSFYTMGINKPVKFQEFFKGLFDELTDYDLFVENDVNLASKGELQCRQNGSDTANDLCYLILGSGFGAGLIFNGHLWTGSSYKAGEVGNLILSPIDLSKPIEEQGKPLEQDISIKAISKHFDINLIEYETISDDLKKGIMDFILPVLVPAVFNIAYMIDLEEYVLDGFTPQLVGLQLIEKLEHYVNQMLKPRGREIHISAPSSNHTTLIGAASLVVESKLKSLLSD